MGWLAFHWHQEVITGRHDGSTVLAMQRVEGEQPPRETEFVNQLLGRRNFMGLTGGADQHRPQDQGRSVGRALRFCSRSSEQQRQEVRQASGRARRLVLPALAVLPDSLRYSCPASPKLRSTTNAWA